MTSAGINALLLIQIHEQISCGDVMLLHLPAQHLVETRNHFGRFGGIRRLRRNRHLHHRSDQRGGEPVSGYIRNQNAQAPLAGLEKIIKVSCHRGHGEITHRHFESRQAGNRARKNRSLDLPGSIHFFLYFAQALFVAQEPQRSHVPQRAEEGDISQRLEKYFPGNQPGLHQVVGDDQGYEEYRPGHQNPAVRHSWRTIAAP